MQHNPFATGKKVYAQGSYAPHRGKMGAKGKTGYFNRELRRKQNKRRKTLHKLTAQQALAYKLRAQKLK